ncbi:hypothetical protein M5K25_024686 [Dendrobium thyrsiflorum]|uniref:Uncharacterized protein n=1 Tax=Dendrobium thyrsiflorum TaxID=117978 RepID=A0ABD0U2V4_DENTH
MSNERSMIKGFNISRPSKPLPIYPSPFTLDLPPIYKPCHSIKSINRRLLSLRKGPLRPRKQERDRRSLFPPQPPLGVPPDHHLRPKVTPDHYLRLEVLPDHHLRPRVLSDHHLRPEVTPNHHLRPGVLSDHQLRPGVLPDHHEKPGLLPYHHLMLGAMPDFHLTTN